MEQGSDQPSSDAYVYALRDEAAYLQTDEDIKPEIVAEPAPDPAWFKCWFCRRTDRRVLFGADCPVRDPNSLAVIALIFIYDKCVANFAESLAQEIPKAPPTVGRRHSLALPCPAGRPWSVVADDRSVGGIVTRSDRNHGLSRLGVAGCAELVIGGSLADGTLGLVA